MPKEERQNVAFLYRTSPRNIDQYAAYARRAEVSITPEVPAGARNRKNGARAWNKFCRPFVAGANEFWLFWAVWNPNGLCLHVLWLITAPIPSAPSPQESSPA